mgnify:CR=1 FL=1
MSYKQDNISQSTAYKVKNMNKSELQSKLTVEDGKQNVSKIPGVEVEIDWYNPDCAVICHFWIDPKIRGISIGTIVIKYVINELRKINRIDYLDISIQAPNKGSINLLEKFNFQNINSYDKSEFKNQVVEGRYNLTK